MKEIDISYKNITKLIEAMEKNTGFINSKINSLCEYNFKMEDFIVKLKEIIAERKK